jgi:hypothetical protein
MPTVSNAKQSARNQRPNQATLPPRKSVASLKIRRLRADIELKDLPRQWVADQAGLGFPTLSSLLSGRRNDNEQLSQIEAVIAAAPTPEDAV